MIMRSHLFLNRLTITGTIPLYNQQRLVEDNGIMRSPTLPHPLTLPLYLVRIEVEPGTNLLYNNLAIYTYLLV